MKIVPKDFMAIPMTNALHVLALKRVETTRADASSKAIVCRASVRKATRDRCVINVPEVISVTRKKSMANARAATAILRALSVMNATI